MAQTPSVRGTFVLNSFDFVREHYGPLAHWDVLRSLPRSVASMTEVLEISWVPLADLVAYMEAAKKLLAPGDPHFHRVMGHYGASQLRALWVGIAVHDPQALRLGPLLWRTFVDSGRLEVIDARPEAAILRIHDLPAAAPFCQRVFGSIEGILRLGGRQLRVEKRACTSRGDPCCELIISRCAARQPEGAAPRDRSAQAASTSGTT